MDRAAEWRRISFSPPAAMKAEWKTVAGLSAGIADFARFLRSFRNKILPDGTLEDRASPELARIRREMEKQRRLIQQSLHGYLRRLAEGGTAQDELITIRGERFVIPVKIEQKRRVQGVVHGASSSGQTVFVEPLETIEQNNELVRLLDEEQAEIHRILLEMTRRIGEHARGDCCRGRNSVRTGTAVCQGALCRRILLRPSSAFAPPASKMHSSCINARHPLLEQNFKQRAATSSLSALSSKASGASSSSPAPTPAAKPSR